LAKIRRKKRTKKSDNNFLSITRSSQKESEKMTSQSNAKKGTEPAIETQAAKSMKRQEATAVK